MLTIAIPTYNRNEIVARQIRRLIPQLTSNCKLLIVDNHSDIPVEDTLQTLWQEFPNLSHEIVRNKQNLGLSGNLLRCFELCETEHIWILGDDDPVKPDAIQIVLHHLEAHPDCFYFNFSFDDQRHQTFTTTGLEEFVDKLDISANIPWISTSVYRAEAILPNLKFGYQYAFSILPHVAMLLVSIGKQERCCLSHLNIIDLDEADTPFENQWSRVSFALGGPTIYDLPMSSALREKLARKLFLTSWGNGVSLRIIVHQLLLESLKYGDRRSTLYNYDQVCARGYYLNSTFKSRAQMRFYRAMLLWPRLTATLFLLITRKRLNKSSLQDRHERI